MGNYIVIALMLAVVGVLVVGVVLMGVGGRLNEKYSQRLMVARVTFQGLALLMLALLFFADEK